MSDGPALQPNGASETKRASETRDAIPLNETVVEKKGPVEARPFSWL